ncbi:MAG TPA: hypothetical protein VGN57_07860 [Pirellulaceae bacterium]|jgi:hypothetical protein|nr:hypothetical protein [Pirellulaceae bacterium]
MFARRASACCIVVVVAISTAGCEWISNLGIPQEIRDKGLLTELEKPIPLGQPFGGSLGAHQVEHPAEMRALLDRMEEFAEGLEDPALRAAYAKSLAAGEPSRAAAFHSLYINQVGGLSESPKQHPLWERIDDALAQGSEPELVEERLVALAAFVRHPDPGSAARLTEAIRDGWNPESEHWESVFASMDDPSDRAWSDAWAAASQKDLDNALGRAILRRLSWDEAPPAIHPFATARGRELLARTMRESQEPQELYTLLGQFSHLDDETGEAIWQAAKERPAGHVRVGAAFTWFRRSGSPDALQALKQAAADERYAIAALNALSRAGRLEEVEMPTGEALARAKAHFVVAESYPFLDSESEQVTLTPLVSGQATFEGDEMEISTFRYTIPADVSFPQAPAADGLAVVDEILVLTPDETSPPDPGTNDPYGSPVPSGESGPEAGAELTSVGLAFESTQVQQLYDEGCRTALDLLAAVGLHSRAGGMYGMTAVESRQDEVKQRLLAADDRWKQFDVPLEKLGFTFVPEAERLTQEASPVEESE